MREMVYQCRRCGVESFGTLIPLSYTFRLPLELGVGAGLAVAGLIVLFGSLGAGAWWLLAGPPGAVLGAVAFSIVVEIVLARGEWLFMRLFRCGKCGARRWTLRGSEW